MMYPATEDNLSDLPSIEITATLLSIVPATPYSYNYLHMAIESFGYREYRQHRQRQQNAVTGIHKSTRI